MIEVDHLPVVDVRHPFLNRGAVSAEEFTDLTAFGGALADLASILRGRCRDYRGRARRAAAVRNTLYFKRMILDLAEFFGVEPDPDAVLEARNAAVAAGYTEYVSKLYGDVGLDTLIFDFGIPLPMLDVAAVRSELPVEVVPVFRIEPLIADLLKTDIGWAEFQRRYDDTIADALTNQGFKGSSRSSPTAPASTSPRSAAHPIRDYRRSMPSGAVSVVAA